MKSKKMVMAAMLAALICVTTMFIKVPLPLKGYINLGDCFVLLAGWFLSPVYGFLAAAIGSALADIFLGYTLYAPVTFVIKGLMAVVACLGFKFTQKRLGSLPSAILCGMAAEMIMVGGYLLFESLLYGMELSLANAPLNGIQGAAGLILGTALLKIFDRQNLDF